MAVKELKVDKTEITSLYMSAAVHGITIGLDSSKTHSKAMTDACAYWNVDVEEEGYYEVRFGGVTFDSGIKITISAEESKIEMILPKTKGYFKVQERNYEQIMFSKNLFLKEGKQKIKLEVQSNDILIMVSSIELLPYATKKHRAEIAKEMEINRAKAYNCSDGFGLMFHWTAECFPRHGERVDYKQAVENFDTEAFAKMICEVGAKFVYITMNHASPHFPAPIVSWDKYFPGQTTKRDLIDDLYTSLNKYDIKLMLYINFTAAYPRSPEAQKLNPGITKFDQTDEEAKVLYTKIAKDILEEIGVKYGEKISAFWFDSSGNLPQHFGSYDFKELYYAAKIGNESRSVTFNYWVLPVSTQWQDHWSGESLVMTNVPPKRELDYGCAIGHMFYVLLTLEYRWVHLTQDAEIEEPLWAIDDLVHYIADINNIGGMVTLNAKIYQDGRMGEKSIETLKEVSRRLEKLNMDS